MTKALLPELQAYDFPFPERLIAQSPASPRDAARLLVYDRKDGTTTSSTFRHLAKFLTPRAVLIFNQTKVVPARLEAQKETGGKVKLLVLEWSLRSFTAFADRRLNVGQTVKVGKSSFRIVRQQGSTFIFQAMGAIRVIDLLERYGQSPIPPYIKHSTLSRRQLKKEYQTIFAKNPGSVAAPTASLHFTPRLMAQLRRAGFAQEYITLHVNLGTFAPLTKEHLRTGRLHVERYEISPKVTARLNRYRKQGRPIIAVGTTVARTLESVAKAGRLKAGRGSTDIFIRPGYRWQFVDGLITNFHVPKSSLMMLVASLVGRKKLLTLYSVAIKKGYRLFSFGDGMLIQP